MKTKSALFLSAALCLAMSYSHADVTALSPSQGVSVNIAPTSDSLGAYSLAATSQSAAQVLASMKKVADWQLAHPRKKYSKGWEEGVGYAGMMALYDVSQDPKYLNAMLAVGVNNEWQPGQRLYHADDQMVIQTYVDLYRLQKNTVMIGPARERLDYILQNPITRPFSRTTANPQNRWSWCDALFMAPAAWARMTAATGDARYLDFADKEWWATTDLLYDPAEKLYYRDYRFIPMRTPNGQKVFWSRGNGWVYAGLARLLEYMPQDYPSRPRYLKLFADMTDAIVKTQQADGLWRPSLLDAEQVPKGETSGSGLFLYGLTWGINHGLLDKAKYWPIVTQGWQAMAAKVDANGKLLAVQPAGDRPTPFAETDTQAYGVGAFLLAGSEIYKNLTGVAPRTGVPPVVVPVAAPPHLPAPDPKPVLPPPTTPRTWARYVPERLDDFAWENDLVAFRVYGPAIKVGSNEGEDSGIDCWVKRVNYPIVDKWYAGEKLGIDYHKDHGEGYDPYHVGSSRGCGGLGIWKNGKLYIAGPYKEWKIVTREPQKTVFELTYDYDVDGEKIHEVKRISIELGSHFFRSDSTFTRNGKPVVLDIAVGVTTHGGKAQATLNQKQGWMACWEKIGADNLGTGAVMAPSRVREMREVKSSTRDQSHALLLTRTLKDGTESHYAGFAWQGADKDLTSEKWQAELARFATTLR